MASCRARRASSRGVLSIPRHAGGLRVAAPGAGDAGVLAALEPAREVAVCRELTKAHEEVVRGSAAELAERYADAPPRGEVVLVLGPSASSRAPARRPRRGVEALRRLVDAGAQPRKAAGVVAELTGGERERALPGR